MRKGFFARLALQNIIKNRKVYFPYMLTAIVTVAMQYDITSLSRNPGLNSDTVALTLGLGVWVTTLFSVIFLFYTNSFLMKRRKKEFGLYNILGMEKKHIGRVVGWETLMILACSLILGFSLGLLMDKLMYMLLVRILGGTADMTFTISGYALVFTALLIGGTFLLIYLNSLRQIHMAKPIELLKGGQVGEREPKARWLLAALGVLTLGAGYWISIRVINPVAVIFLFFLAVILVIIGTYLLFTAGSVSALKLMRRNKGYYYRPAHFINVSTMMYRMKQNAVGLANICVLSTMVLVMLFSTVALRFGVEDMVSDRCPSNVTIEIGEYDHGDELDALAHEQAAALGLNITVDQRYRYLTFSGYKQGDHYETNRDDVDLERIDMFGDGLNILYVTPLEDYNRMFGKSETLEADEILLRSQQQLTNAALHTGDTLSTLGMTFRVKARFDEPIENGTITASIYSVQYIVVKDMDVLERINAKQREVYGKHAGAIALYYGVDADGGDAAVYKLYEALRPIIRERYSNTSIECKPSMRISCLALYGGLFFIGLFLGMLFIMAMILIVYYKQISEGYDDQERYRIMRKVGLSRAEIKRAISSQIRTVFFLPLAAAGVHVAFSFPAISRMFRALGMYNVPLEIWCALGAFALFTLLYSGVYALTARVYYKIVSAR